MASTVALAITNYCTIHYSFVPDETVFHYISLQPLKCATRKRARAHTHGGTPEPQEVTAAELCCRSPPLDHRSRLHLYYFRSPTSRPSLAAAARPGVHRFELKPLIMYRARIWNNRSINHRRGVASPIKRRQ